jgi:hypothetical protein
MCKSFLGFQWFLVKEKYEIWNEESDVKLHNLSKDLIDILNFSRTNLLLCCEYCNCYSFYINLFFKYFIFFIIY